MPVKIPLPVKTDWLVRWERQAFANKDRLVCKMERHVIASKDRLVGKMGETGLCQ